MHNNTSFDNKVIESVTDQSKYWTSGYTLDVPEIDLVNYVFERRDTINPDLKVFVNAENEEEYVTYGQAHRGIWNVAKQIKELGLEEGDCVCIHSYNHIHYPLLWLGVIAAGGVVTGSNPANTTQELVHHLTITNTKLVIVHADRVNSIVKAAEHCGLPSGRIVVFGCAKDRVPSDCNRLAILLESQPDFAGKFVTQSDALDPRYNVIAYATTSGTTGLPKAAELTHRYFVAQLASTEGVYQNRDEEISQLHCLPLFHAFAAPIALLLPLRLGITTYLLPRFHVHSYVKAVSQFQITDTAVVPPIVAALVKLPSRQRFDLRSIRFMICAGAPLTATIQSALRKSLHHRSCISQCWGCTEVGWISTFHKSEEDTSGSVGFLLPNVSLKIVDHEGKVVVGDGVRGEAYIRSESMLLGYRTGVRSIDKSQLCDQDGFYATGDVVYVDNGKIYIQGRIKDIMKVNGWQVSPDELQSVIMQLSAKGVKDCAVVGCTRLDHDGLQITMPRAFVVRCQDSNIGARDIRAHVKKQLVSYKQITSGVMFVKEIPRNPTGKIVRRLLETMTVVEDENEFVEQGSRVSASLSFFSVMIKMLCFMVDSAGLLFVAVLLEKVLHEP